MKLASLLAVIALSIQVYLLKDQGFVKQLASTEFSAINQYNVNSRTEAQFQEDTINSTVPLLTFDENNENQPNRQLPSTTPSSTASDCIRHCANRKNRIYGSIGFAGMSDRASLVVMLSKLAGSLCAVVDLPPPMSSFARSHNQNKKLREEVRWDDLFNVTFRQDGSQSLYDVRDNPNRSVHDERNKRRKKGTLLGFYNRSKYPPDWNLLISNKSSNLLHDFEEIQRYSWEHEHDPGRGFLWEIHQILFNSELRKVDRLPGLSDMEAKQLRPEQIYHDRMRPSLLTKVPACQYASQTPEEMEPAQLHTFRTELRLRVQALAPTGTSLFGFFHIRRGDSKKACNTTLPDLESYLKCSLNGTESTGKKVTLLMGSDERNAKYRQQVLDLVNKDNTSYPQVSMLDADATTKELMEDLVASKAMPEWLSSNHYQFLLLQGIGMLGAFNFSSFYLSRRRSDCRPCNHLLTSYPELWQ